MSPQELAAIVTRDAEADPYECEYCHEYGPAPAEEDRRALLALLRETREALHREHDGETAGVAVEDCPTCRVLRDLAALGPP